LSGNGRVRTRAVGWSHEKQYLGITFALLEKRHRLQGAVKHRLAKQRSTKHLSQNHKMKRGEMVPRLAVARTVCRKRTTVKEKKARRKGIKDASLANNGPVRKRPAFGKGK